MFVRTAQPLLNILIALAVLAALGPVAAPPAALAEKPAAAAGVRIERLDPRFDALVPRDAVVEKVVDTFEWVEGPVWNREGNFLLFSEIPSNSIYKWQESNGTSLFLRPSGYTGPEPFTGKEPGSNGLTFDSTGRLVLCEHGDRRIARLEVSGRKTTLADRYEGPEGSGRLNSPNDLVFHSSGDLYFTDPPFGLPGGFEDPAKELPFQGVYRLTKEGKLTLLTRDVRAPNGIGFSPDEKTLYVSNADRGNPVWYAFEVNPHGTLGSRRVFFDGTALINTAPGVPDGLKVDRRGNVFVAGPGGIYVLAPDGTHLGSFLTGVATSNSAWGGDGSVLYFTAGSTIYRVRLTTSGKQPF
jgi:gluconolactonase